MSLFGGNKSTECFGAVVDIGSGSVLVSVVHSDPSKKFPQIVWSHREQAPLRNINSLEQSAKAVMTALVNSSMLLDGEGRKALQAYRSGAQLTKLQFSISAPWAYTITKTINYSQEEDFLVTEELVAELYKAIEDKISNELEQDKTLHELGLEVIAKMTMDLSSNGYHVAHPEGNKTKTLTISQSNSVAHKYLVEATEELKDKLFPKTTSKSLSFILMLYTITKDFLRQSNDVCLVDITYEATEIGVVREGILTYCTHTPFGSFSIAREISDITGVPLHESFGYLHLEKPYDFLVNLNKQQKTDVELVFEAYTERVSNLFKETGDSLSIPKKISLHTDLNTETLFSDLIHKAATRNLKTQPTVTSISKEIIEQYQKEQTSETENSIATDTALFVSAQFFHNNAKHPTIEYF